MPSKHKAPVNAANPAPAAERGLAGWWAEMRAHAGRAVGSSPGLRRAPAAADNALAASWRDPTRRPWLIIGAISLLLLPGLLITGPTISRRLVPAPAAAPTVIPGEGAPAAEQAPPAQTPSPPAAEPANARRAPSPPAQLALAALPLLLGMFWLLSAWLVDVEARRAFVVQEPWGDRRTVAYSCLAVGCVFPLILAGLIFAAWGFVSFVLFVANRQSWTAGIEAGALILLVCGAFLLLRSAAARWQAGRNARV